MKFSLNFRQGSEACTKAFLNVLFVVTFWFCVMCTVGLSTVSPVDARLFNSESRSDVASVNAQSNFESGRTGLPSIVASQSANGEISRRRSRRSSDDVDWREFRQFIHRFRKSSLRLDLDKDQMSRRNSATNSMEKRLSTGNTIASTVRCGGCKLTKQWIPIKKPGCRPNFIYVPSCIGMCQTWEIPDINPPYFITNHKVCRPKTIEYTKIRLRRCNPGVNIFYMMPMAKNCECAVCNSKNTACRPFL